MANVGGNTIRDAVEAFSMYIDNRTGGLSDDFTFPAKLVYYYLNMYRLRVEAEDKRFNEEYDVNPAELITIPCVELCEIDIIECPCAPAKGCTFFKSVHPLPKISGGMPKAVATLDGGELFNYVPWYQFSSKVNSRHKSVSKGFYYTFKTIDNETYLYVYRSCCFDNLQAVAVSAKFQDPLEVLCFPICGEERQVCSPLDELFIIDQEIQSRVFELTFQTLVSFKNSNPESEIINNDNDDTEAKLPQF